MSHIHARAANSSRNRRLGSSHLLLACRRILRSAWTLALGATLLAHSGLSYGAQVVHECSADKYKRCSSFLTSVAIQEQTSIIRNSFSGFTKSKGRWTIQVGYEPSESCAVVSMLVDMGPLEFYRKYERVFIDGGGVISDSGAFMHQSDDLQSALSVDSSSCYVPDDAPGLAGSRPEASEGSGKFDLDKELDRLAHQDGVSQPQELDDGLGLDDAFSLLESQEEARAREAKHRAEMERAEMQRAELERQNAEEAARLQEVLAAGKRRAEAYAKAVRERSEALRRAREAQEQRRTQEQHVNHAVMQTFLGILGGAIEMYQDDHGSSPPSYSNQAPSRTKNISGNCICGQRGCRWSWRNGRRASCGTN